MGKKKNNISSKMKENLVSVLNRSLTPAEYSYKTFKKAARKIKKAAPLVYEEIETLIKSNIV